MFSIFTIQLHQSKQLLKLGLIFCKGMILINMTKVLLYLTSCPNHFAGQLYRASFPLEKQTVKPPLPLCVTSFMNDPKVTSKTRDRRKRENRQWHHCREWQSSKILFCLLCGYIYLKKYTMLMIFFLFPSDAIYKRFIKKHFN